MGWTTGYKPKGESLTDFFTRRGGLRWTVPDLAYRVLDSALVNFTEYYAAVEKVNTVTGERIVWAAIFRIRMYRESSHDGNFAWKDQDETCGCLEVNCPARILKLLTPTDNEHANEWRAACWARIEARKRAPTLKPGLAIAFTPPLAFNNGLTHSRMEVDRLRGSRVRLKDANGYDGYYVSNQRLSKMIISGRATFPSVQP